MQVTIEAPEGWGPGRMLLGRPRQLGYEVEDDIILGRHLFVISSQPEASDRLADDQG
jgi:hypothetical protein